MRVISTTRLTNELEKELIEAHPSVTFQFEPSITEVTNIAEADILMTYGEDISVPFLEKAKRLKWIMVLSAGVDEMPLDWIREHNIVVTNAKGIHKHPMSEYAMAMLLGHYREMFTFYEQQKAKLWNQKVKTREINHRKMTIIGAGVIGEELARLAQAFHIETTAVTRSGGERQFFNKSVTMKEIDSALNQADFVISILPSTKETRPFYHADHFKKMKKSAIFLNMGRGDVVDAHVLMDALDQGEISHAILDVSPEEPLPAEHPLWSHEKVTLTPHISGKSAHYLPRSIAIFKDNLISYLKDQSLPVNKINLTRGY